MLLKRVTLPRILQLKLHLFILNYIIADTFIASEFIAIEIKYQKRFVYRVFQSIEDFESSLYFNFKINA